MNPKAKALKKGKDAKPDYGIYRNHYGSVNKITGKQQDKAVRKYSDIQAGRK